MDFQLVNLRQKPLSDFVLDWESEDPDFKIKIQISQSDAPIELYSTGLLHEIGIVCIINCITTPRTATIFFFFDNLVNKQSLENSLK